MPSQLPCIILCHYGRSSSRTRIVLYLSTGAKKASYAGPCLQCHCSTHLTDQQHAVADHRSCRRSSAARTSNNASYPSKRACGATRMAIPRLPVSAAASQCSVAKEGACRSQGQTHSGEIKNRHPSYDAVLRVLLTCCSCAVAVGLGGCNLHSLVATTHIINMQELDPYTIATLVAVWPEYCHCQQAAAAAAALMTAAGQQRRPS
jgi:hypothetical protein